MTAGTRSRIVPVLLSLLFHGGLVALLLFGWWHWRTNRPPPAPQTLAIEATVVSELPPARAPVAEPAAAPAPEPAPPVEPTPDHAKAEAEAKAAAAAKALAEQQRAEQAKAQQTRTEREHAAKDKATREQAASDKAEREQAEREQAAREKAEREAAARDQAARDKAAKEQAARTAAERQRKEAQRRQAEADMRASLEVEARQTAARLSNAKAAYMAMIRERIQRAWIKPPGARAGLDCVVKVTQVPGGAVTGVNIGACNGDEAVKGSIEAAVYRASPLPEPADPAVFDRDLVFNFRPNE
jgi:colicin import membrane protein